LLWTPDSGVGAIKTIDYGVMYDDEEQESEVEQDSDQVSMFKNFFPLSLMTRPNKLEGLALGTLSSWVLEFEGKARANTIGGPFRCFLLG
jgi:hypothetical protein